MHSLSGPGDILTWTSGINKPQVIVAQMGARRHYAVPALLHRAGMLAHFYTDIYGGPGSPWHILSKAAAIIPEAYCPKIVKSLLARHENCLPPEKVTAFNLLGLRFAFALRRLSDPEAQEKLFLTYGKYFCELILDKNLDNGDVVYAFQSVALPLFLRASELGMHKILDMPSAPDSIQFQLYSEEYDTWPDWELPYPGLEVWQPRNTLEKEECRLADSIVCGSEFVAQGLTSLGVPSEKIQVVYSGVDTSRFAAVREPWNGRRPLRLLFLGSISLRKGVQYLYLALKKLKGLPLSVRLVGGVSIREPFCSELKEKTELTGHIPRHEVHRHYGWADVFVFPSICEGSAMVTYEALAAGLPVITTPNAGSVVRDGLDGFIIPIRDSDTLAEKIDLLAKKPELLSWMSQNARERAQNYSRGKYGERLISGIKLFCETSNTL